jgi:hypothetical protein
MSQRPGASIGWGALIVLAGPIVLIVLMISLVGLPLALLLAGAWVAALTLSGLLAAVTVGRWITGRAGWNSSSLPLALLIGVPVTLIILGLPSGIGGLLSLAVAFWAMGGLALSLRPARD